MLLFLARTIKFALQGFFRNFWLSVVTIIILVLTLCSITLVAGINVVAEQAIASIQDRVDVSIYFKQEVSENDALAVRDRLLGLAEVETVTYVSKEDALEKFKSQHQDDTVILEAIEQLEENPLSATIIIKADSIEEYTAILAVLDNPQYSNLIEERNFDDNETVISRLSDVSNRIEQIGIIISAIFVLIAVLIVFNTIRINIYTHREEIGIMKLVGSSNAFVRMPFIIETFMYALISVVLTIAILYPLMNVVAPQVSSFFEGYDLDLATYVHDHIFYVIGMQLVFSVLLSTLSASIAIGRYLKV
ncbi:MAG: ABC transporter permease [Candidatus Kerfeldbacteria bacterium]|nr:ABC transporter permease [Candidatus Kerfeldbacteria bacterium]